MTALEGLRRSRRHSRPGLPEGIGPRPSERPFRPASFIPYFRAIRADTLALSKRMADSFLAAFDQWRAEHSQPQQ